MKLSLIAAALAAMFTLPGAGVAATLGTFDGKPPVVTAHRGASGYLPEHTLGGYELAMKMGADYIEPDLQMTADGVLVAMHDATLTRTTDVRTVFPGRASYRVSDFTLVEIKQLTVKPVGPQAGTSYPGFDPSMDEAYRVPTFTQVLNLLNDYNTANGTNIGIYPEAKAPTTTAMNRQILEELQAAGLTSSADKVFIQSFDFNGLREIGDMQATFGSDQLLVALGNASMIGGDYFVGGTRLSDIAGFANGLGVSLGGASGGVALTRGFVDAAHGLGLLVHGYTLRPLTQAESDAQMVLLVSLGYDGFFTDYTDRSRASLDALIAPAPVPLPAGGLLILTAMGGLALLRRRAADTRAA